MPIVLKKELVVSEVSVADKVRAPFILVLGRGTKDNRLCFDEKALSRHGIPFSLELVGKRILCTLSSRELPLHPHSSTDFSGRGVDDLLIKSVKSVEEYKPEYMACPPLWYELPARTLELERECVSGPGYHLVLDLDEAEFEVCKALPANTAFTASFSFISEEGE